MKRKLVILLTIIMIVFVVSASFIGCTNEESDGEVVTDLLGREVTVPNDPQRILCIGAGALRLYSYVGDMSKLCGVENVEKTDSVYGKTLALRAYKEINQDIFDSLQDCGKGGPANQSAEAEAIIECNPDLIISLYTSDASAADTLQAQTNCPVIVLSYGSTLAFDTNVKKSISLLGKVLNKEDRANELIDYIDDLQSDLGERTSDIADEDKPTVYVGAQSFYGSNGFLSSSLNYSIFNLINVKNALSETTYTGVNVTVDLETLVSLDPDKIIVDAGGIAKMKSEYANQETADVYNALSAVKKGEVYLQMPYNAYYTNIETAYIDAYYIASVVYPAQFSDVDIAKKADEIFTMFLGDNFYEKLSSTYFGGFQKINNLEEFVNAA